MLLGIETAPELVGVAVGDAGGVRATSTVTGRRRHVESLAPAINHVLSQAGVAIGELNAVCVDVGPGLFTGLRVGVATAKGLVQGLGIGAIGVTSLETLAHGALDGGWPGSVLAVVDARRSEVFVAAFGRLDPVDASSMVELEAPCRFAPAELARFIEAAPWGGGADVLCVGDGARRYAADLAAVKGVVVAGPTMAAPQPASLVTLAAARLAAGSPTLGAADIHPLYLREADAVANFAERSGSRASP
jgi:tRNA threonylcarbamoyladenosine biosynthesis protein TsaB